MKDADPLFPAAQLRTAQPCDAYEVFSLYRRVIEAGAQRGNSCWDDSYPTLAIALQDAREQRLFVLYEGRQLIGAVSIDDADDFTDSGLPLSPGRFCPLARLCVDPDFQGKGIAQRIMEQVTRIARERGFSGTRHLCDLKNPAALSLYRRMGYRSLGKVALYGHLYEAFERRF